MGAGVLRGIVALDGPSGTGKSTVAKRLAATLGARYLDTGAMYRAVTLAVLRAGIDPADAAKVIPIAKDTNLIVGLDPKSPSIELGPEERPEDVAAEIRGPEVTANVSAVSAIPEVRELLVEHQQWIINTVVGAGGGIVVEGRDIGTVVAPDAGLKVYLTASAQARAQRRSRQDNAAGRTATIDATRIAVEKRDLLDSTRAASPLRAAPDSIELDTTDIDVYGVLRRLIGLVEQRGMRGGRG